MPISIVEANAMAKHKADSTSPSARESASGPRLLFDRGIFSRWYVLFRLIEEIDRAGRYDRPLAVIVAKPALLPGEKLAQGGRAAAAEAASRTARSTDLVGWLSDDSILIIMPETPQDDARSAVNRWQSEMWLHSRTRGGQKWDVVVLDQLEDFATLERFHVSIDERANGAVA
jgi:hypothetical protein